MVYTKYTTKSISSRLRDTIRLTGIVSGDLIINCEVCTILTETLSEALTILLAKFFDNVTRNILLERTRYSIHPVSLQEGSVFASGHILQ